jgi:SAM-dependent MidA family methyltransferase
MTPLTEILRDHIRQSGPVSFRWFMETALYHSEHGYYRRDPFGRAGDFYTAEQIQPVFGILMAQYIRQLWRRMGEPDDFTVVELGPGRREMESAFKGFRYVPVDVGQSMPERIRGVVFSNEFFDALPVHRVMFVDDEAREALVGWKDERFVWVVGSEPPASVSAYLARYLPGAAEALQSIEVNVDALEWMQRIGKTLESGFHMAIDYGYSAREVIRFPQGSLMSYRAHRAVDDVLTDPGLQDITAHVCFSALIECGDAVGLRKQKFQSLSATLLDAGREDEFAAALDGGSERKLQLKSLLFGMGEQFRTLVQAREGVCTK